MSVSSNHSAAGQLAGYLFQPERALYHLARSPRGSMIGIETLDDVSVRFPNGKTIYEQDKHSVGKRSPLAESKAEMWKAFNIWLQGIAQAEVDLDCSEFHLVTNKRISSGFCHLLLKEPRSVDSIKALVSALRQAGKSASKSVRLFSDAVLAYSDEQISALFERVRLVDGSKRSAGSDLKANLADILPLPPGKEEEVIQSLLGWVHDTTLELIRRGEAAWLSREAFSERYIILVSKFHDQRFLNETAEALIPITDDKRIEHQRRLFVKQLLWLGFPEDDDQLIEAIDDFIRSTSERIRLAKAGTATLVDFEHFENRLVSRWKNLFRNAGQPSGEDARREKGKNTLFQTLDHREHLAGFETQEYYLTRGAYHQLADGPALKPKVGWHPQFNEKCTSKKTE